MNRERQKAFLTGSNGNYPGDRIMPQSELGDNNGYMGNYGKTFLGGTDGSVHLGQPDYSNPKNTLHNNLGDRVMLEQVFENRLFIDSAIRDYSKHHEPFKFIVKFNGIYPKTEDICVEIDNESYCYVKYLSGDTTVLMDRTFKNIKAVIINALILPHNIEFKTEPNGSYVETGRNLERKHYKYIILKINELSNWRSFSNKRALGQESFIMKLDDDGCINFHRWIPMSKHIAYPDSRLSNVDRLTVEICNDKGEKLQPKLDDNPHDFFEEYRKLIDKIIILQQKGKHKEIEDYQPKLQSLKRITECLSPELHITLCTLDPQINTLPQFRY